MSNAAIRVILIFAMAAACLARAEDKPPQKPPEKPVEAQGEKLDFAHFTGHFESNMSTLRGEQSYIVVATQAEFEATFGTAFVAGGKKTYLPKDAFEKKLVLATVKRGNTAWTYQVEKVTLDGKTLNVQYTATASAGGGGTAKFASPMIVAVPRGNYQSVVFIENGKAVGTAKIAK